MPERFAIYYAPEQGSAFAERAAAWLGQSPLEDRTVSARRYGFHATLKAPMALAEGQDRAGLEAALAAFAADTAPVVLDGLAPRPIEEFLAMTTEPQPAAVTDLAAKVVEAFEPFRAPLTAEDRARRLKAPLTPRQIELVDRFGYPYVLEAFQFHMTLTDRLPAVMQTDLQRQAEAWFVDVLAEPIRLDRLALFHEAEPGAAFRRLDDFVLEGKG